MENKSVQIETTCDMCSYFFNVKVKTGPAQIGKTLHKSECRRFPPSTIPVLSLSLNAMSKGLEAVKGLPMIMKDNPVANQQHLVIQPVGGAAVYPPVAPGYLSCGEFCMSEEAYDKIKNSIENQSLGQKEESGKEPVEEKSEVEPQKVVDSSEQ